VEEREEGEIVGEDEKRGDLKRTGKIKIGFLQDERRMNVALTRARFVMIVVGNSETLSVDYNWKNYVDFIAENKCYFSAGNQIQNFVSLLMK
jgi:senataxin